MTFVREFRQLSPSGARIFLSSGHFFYCSLVLAMRARSWRHGEKGEGGERSLRVDHVHPHTHTHQTPFFLLRVRDALVSGFYDSYL